MNWRPSRDEVESEDECMIRRQADFRLAAEYVARAFAQLQEVQKAVLFGSVARPLRREVPRFREFRRAGVEVWHECKDVDVAVWLSDLGCLRALQLARSRALGELLRDRAVGVAHHQVDVFVMAPGPDRYLGRLCTFGSCPKQGKAECLAPGCGAMPLLRQHPDFALRPEALAAEAVVVLFDRQTGGASG